MTVDTTTPPRIERLFCSGRVEDGEVLQINQSMSMSQYMNESIRVRVNESITNLLQSARLRSATAIVGILVAERERFVLIAIDRNDTNALGRIDAQRPNAANEVNDELLGL